MFRLHYDVLQNAVYDPLFCDPHRSWFFSEDGSGFPDKTEVARFLSHPTVGKDGGEAHLFPEAQDRHDRPVALASRWVVRAITPDSDQVD